MFFFSEDNCPLLWRQSCSAHFRGDNCALIWRQFGSGQFSVNTICQCFFLVKTIVHCSEDNYAVLILEETIVHWSEDNLTVPYFLWRQSSSAPFLVKTIVLLLLILWRQLYYCYLFCEDNCTSAHEDNFTSEDDCTISPLVPQLFQKFWNFLLPCHRGYILSYFFLTMLEIFGFSLVQKTPFAA